MRAAALLARLRASFHLRAGLSLWMPAAIAITFFVFLALDPFNIGKASGARSEQATLRIVSPFYQPSGKVTVIVIDDEYLRSRESGWPLRYAEQGRLLRQILSNDPAVLVVDLVYPHRHGDIQALFDPIRSSGDTPIVFTAMAREPSYLPQRYQFCMKELAPGGPKLDLLDPRSAQPELLALARPDGTQPDEANGRFNLAFVRWSGCGNRYPLVLGGDPAFLTPAFAAYRAFCSRHPGEASCARGNPVENVEDYLHPMIVRAGAFPPAEQSFAFGEQACQRFAPRGGETSAWRRLIVTLQQLTLGVFKDLRDEKDNNLSLPCPAVTVAPLSTLVNAPREDWNELLHGKLVLLGANISGVPDFIDTPVHGLVPGVVWHGMALDNLLSLGSGYLAERYGTLQKVIGFVLAMIFAYAFPFIVGLLEHPRLKKALIAASFSIWPLLAAMYFYFGDPTAAVTALAVGVGFDLMKPSSSATYLIGIAAAAIGSLFFLSRGWPPGNWMGLVFVLVAFSSTVKPYYRSEERRNFPHRASVLRNLYRFFRPL